ncbi:MAG: hypothetical protein ACEY3J_00485 [Arsenophonus sp.]
MAKIFSNTEHQRFWIYKTAHPVLALLIKGMQLKVKAWLLEVYLGKESRDADHKAINVLLALFLLKYSVVMKKLKKYRKEFLLFYDFL